MVQQMPRSEEYAAEVGERIVTARKEASLTQVELAELVGVSQRSMQAYENGEVIPYRKMRDIAKVLERPVEHLLYGDAGFMAPDERLGLIEEALSELARTDESVQRSLERLTRAVEALTKKIK